MGDLFSFERFFHNIPILLPYFAENLKVLFYATLFGVLLGLLVTLVRIKKPPVLFQIVTVYISFMRGTPMLVQLMLIYYGLPLLIDPIFGTNIGRSWNSSIFAYTTFVLNQGAFLSSIFLSAIQAIPKGQSEAAYSVGLTGFQCFYRIVAPQAVRIALPPFGTDFIGVLHNASLVYVIGVVDVMGRAKAIGSSSGHILEAYAFVALLFVVCSLLARFLFAMLDRRLDYSGKCKRTSKLEELEET
jgi:L-cystine transport system permease protein